MAERKALMTTVIVKHIAGFLEFNDVVTLYETQKSIREDLKPVIRKAEVAMLKENGKLKTALCSLTRAICYMRDVRRMEYEWQEIRRVLDNDFNFSNLAIQVEAFPGETPGGVLPPGGVLTLHGWTDDIIVQHFLDQMD